MCRKSSPSEKRGDRKTALCSHSCLQEEGHLVGRDRLPVGGAGLGQDGVDLRAGHALRCANVLEEGLDAVGRNDLDQILLEARGEALTVAAVW